jgi:acyl-CoA thioester hydrolase
MTELAPPEGFRHFADLCVRFAETDAQGVVYHANFLIYCEVARSEYFRAMHGERPWRENRGYETVLAHAACDYRAPARFDDQLRIWTRIAKVGRSSLTYEYKIVKRDGTLVCDARTVQVAVDKKTREPTPFPPEVGDRIRAFESG